MVDITPYFTEILRLESLLDDKETEIGYMDEIIVKRELLKLIHNKPYDILVEIIKNLYLINRIKRFELNKTIKDYIKNKHNKCSEEEIDTIQLLSRRLEESYLQRRDVIVLCNLKEEGYIQEIEALKIKNSNLLKEIDQIKSSKVKEMDDKKRIENLEKECNCLKEEIKVIKKDNKELKKKCVNVKKEADDAIKESIKEANKIYDEAECMMVTANKTLQECINYNNSN